MPGVSLRVLNSTSGELAGDYPLQENTQVGAMVSGADGVIICHQPRSGLQFGGFCWDLLWVIPIGPHSGPEFRFEFIKDGFQSRVLTTREFFNFPGQTYDAAPKSTTRFVHGVDEEMPIWKLKVALRRNKLP